MRIALIKTSSMGDVIHAFPVVTDILRAIPNATIDWVVEESFAQLPPLHPAVGQVIPVAVRRWRRHPLRADVRREVACVRQRLGADSYDWVLDLQGLIKSAMIARWARGPRVGFSFGCARERLAALAYDRRYPVDMTRHAIERLRELAGRALGYQPQGLPSFALAPPGGRLDCVPEQPYAVLLHATSRAEKQWPLQNWQALVRSLADRGIHSVLAWGSEAERGQAEAIAASAPSEGGRPAATVLPRLSLSQCAVLLRDARRVVGVDTGLTHLACALDRPTVALFGATPAWRFGPYWSPRAQGLESVPGRWPTPAEVADASDALERA